MEAAKLLVASTNRGKVREIQACLSGLLLEIQTLADIPALPAYPEEGRTFLENARGKSLYYSQAGETLVLAEDSGLEIAALSGAPGVFSARFSGEAATDKTNIEKVLDLLRDVPPERRQARFVCCAVLSQGGQVITEITGTVGGLITRETRGEAGFGYDPIFFYPPLDKTFGQMPPQEKNSVSHRGKALTGLRVFLMQYLADRA